MIEQFLGLLQPFILAVVVVLVILMVKTKKPNFISFDVKMLGLISVYAAWEVLEFVVSINPGVHEIMESVGPWFYLLITLAILALAGQRALEVFK